MPSWPLYHVDAFTNRPFGGNPAGVVLEADGLSPAQMQLLARELKHSETAFVSASTRADYRIRFFTPLREVDLCGHATLAAAWVLALEGRLPRGRARQETRAGVFDLDVGRDRIGMSFAAPRLEAVDVRREELGPLLGSTEVPSDRPLVKAYAGEWILAVPAADEAAVNLCRPRMGELAALSLELGVLGVHVYAVEPEGSLYTRFFAPAAGIPEDPVTGVANAALAGALVLSGAAAGPRFRVRQGDAVDRPGEMDVHATPTELRVTGQAVVLSSGRVTL